MVRPAGHHAARRRPAVPALVVASPTRTTSAVTAISTLAPRGSEATPTAALACRPSGPSAAIESVAGTVRDLRMLHELGIGRDEHGDLKEPLQAIQAAPEVVADRRQRLQGGPPGRLLPHLDRHLLPETARHGAGGRRSSGPDPRRRAAAPSGSPERSWRPERGAAEARDRAPRVLGGRPRHACAASSQTSTPAGPQLASRACRLRIARRSVSFRPPHTPWPSRVSSA